MKTLSNNGEKKETIKAFVVSGSTNISAVTSQKIAKQAQEKALAGKIVAISMDGISSMSLDASTLLCSQLWSNQELAKRILIKGGTPYINKIIRAGIRNAKQQNK